MPDLRGLAFVIIGITILCGFLLRFATEDEWILYSIVVVGGLSGFGLLKRTKRD